MAQPSPTPSMDDGVGLLKPKLNLASLNSKVLISEPLLVVYEHIQKLRERGQGVEADHMDDSDDVTKYCETSGSKATAKSFNAVWAAKDFRAALYDAVAAKSGGPVWLRDSIKVTDAEGMSLTRIPHVWNGLLQEAKALTGTLIGPSSPAATDAAQRIRLKDLLELEKLCGAEDGSLDLRGLEDLVFPAMKPPKKSPKPPEWTSPVTGHRYQYGRGSSFMNECDTTYRCQVFECLATHALNRTPIAQTLECLNLANLAPTSGRLTGNILRHVMFWFQPLDDHESRADDLSRPWTDHLKEVVFRHQDRLNVDGLERADEIPEKAAQILVQALFDMTRKFDITVPDWKDLVDKTPAAFFLTVSYLPSPSQGACYRQRFQHREWFQILCLVKSYTGSRFQGCMELYNEMSISVDRYPQISMFAGIEQALLAARLACPPTLPFLDTEQVRGDFVSEATTFLAAFLYRRTKETIQGGQEAASSVQESHVQREAQSIHPASDATAQAMLTDSARILRSAGFDPKPADVDESLAQYSFRPPTTLPLRLSQRDETADYAPGGAGLFDSQRQSIPEMPNGGLIDDAEISLDPNAHPEAPLGSESPLGEGLETPGKKRKRSTQQ